MFAHKVNYHNNTDKYSKKNGRPFSKSREEREAWRRSSNRKFFDRNKKKAEEQFKRDSVMEAMLQMALIYDEFLDGIRKMVGDNYDIVNAFLHDGYYKKLRKYVLSNPRMYKKADGPEQLRFLYPKPHAAIPIVFGNFYIIQDLIKDAIDDVFRFPRKGRVRWNKYQSRQQFVCPRGITSAYRTDDVLVTKAMRKRYKDLIDLVKHPLMP